MIITADFQYLVFLNYQIDRELLEPRVPEGVQLQLLNGKPYVSLVAFLFENLHVEGLPAPFHQKFEEVNLRFYVKQKASEDKNQGVVFIREIVPKTLVAATARVIFNENYISLPMEHRFKIGEQINEVEYRWKTTNPESFIRITFENQWQYPESNSNEEFLINRPYAFTRMKDGKTREIKMEHPIWRICPARNVVTEFDIPAVFGIEFVPYLTLRPASAFIAEGSSVVIKG